MCHPAQGHKKDLQACRAWFVRILDEVDAGKEPDKDVLRLLDAAIDMVIKKIDSSAYKAKQLRHVAPKRSAGAGKDSDAPARLLLGLNPAASPLVSEEDHQRVQRRLTGTIGDRKRQSSTGYDDSSGRPNKRRTQDGWDSTSASEHNQTRRVYSHHEDGNPWPQIANRNPRHSVAHMVQSSSTPDFQSLPELPGVETLLRVEQEGNRKKRERTQLPKLSTLCLPVNHSAMAGPSPPIFDADRSGSREQQHQAASATLPPLKLAAEGHQYHHHQLPLVLSPEPQDPTIYHHHKLPDPVLPSQDADSRQSSTDQPPSCRTHRLNACFETPSSPHVVPRRMTASSFQVSPLVQPRRESLSADSLSQEDEVMLDDGTRFKVIRDSKEYTTFEKL